jgi:hypothetical protein
MIERHEMQTNNRGLTPSPFRAAAFVLALSSAAVLAQVSYPAAVPGPARILLDGSQISISNSALSASWRVGDVGLRPEFFRDAASQRQVTLTGEAFEIVLTNGECYAASALRRDGPARLSELTPDSKAARLAARIPGRQAEVPLRSADGRLRVVWRAVLHDGGNYIRQEVDATATREDCVIREIVWLNQAIPDAQPVGVVDGSPVVAGDFFFGSEDPHALNEVRAPRQEIGTWSPQDMAVGQPRSKSWPLSAAQLQAGTNVFSFLCRIPRNVVLKRGDTMTQSFVFGVAPAGQMRRAFLYYLERERAHPYRPYLHYNSWYDTAWSPFALNETNCLEAIRLCGERLIKPHGVIMDGMVFDDGWDDPKTLWRFHSGFPNRFKPLAELCREYNTHLGVWLSPFGGYGEPKEQRIKFGRAQGYELNATGFSLAGPKYYAAFRDACAGMIRNYGVNHFKFDGIAAGMAASGGAQYVLDTEAMRRLMLELRQEDPNLYINLTTGSWPSPFWLRYADSVWRQGGDMGLAGKGTRQQQWLTYRDQEVYRNIVGKGPLYPLNSLMTQGVAYSRQGMAGDPTFNSAGFKDDVHAFFGSGTALQELYIQPGKLTAEDWRALAEAAKWSRANADVLVDTHWIGGDPAKLQVYGYASWSARKGIVMLRNPDVQPREYALDVAAAFELPLGAQTKYLLKSPWSEDAAKPALRAEAGKPLRIPLKPFEIVVLDALPSD